MKRIAIIAEHFSPPYDEGFKKATSGIIDGLLAIGKQLAVFSPANKNKGWGVPNNRLLIGRGLRSRLRDFDPALVIYIPRSAATPMSLLRAKLLKLQSGKPVVLVSLQQRSYHPLVKPICKSFCPDLVMVLSEKSRKIMEDLGAKVTRIRLGVDVDRFKPATEEHRRSLRNKYRLPDKKIILHIGHISQRRNLDILTTLNSPETQVVMVSSTTTTAVKRLKHRLISWGTILIDTYSDSIEEIYQISDLYVFPTFDPKGAIEIPLSVLEAMATNLPIVSSPFGGLPDLFSEVKGLLFARHADQFPNLIGQALAIQSVETRQAVLNLSWKSVAEEIVNAIEVNLR